MILGWTLLDVTTLIRGTAARINQALEALEDVGRINESVSRAESAQRGFFIATDERYIAERDRALAAADERIDRLAWRLREDPLQKSRAAELKKLFGARAALMRERESLRRLEGFDRIVASVEQGVGQAASAGIYALTEKVRQDEAALLARTRIEQRANYDSALTILVAGMGILLALLIPGYIGFIREAAGRYRAEQQMTHLADSLPDAIFRMRRFPDGTRRFEYLSAATEKVRGVSREAALRDANVVVNSVAEADRPALAEAMARSAERVEPIVHEFRVVDASGATRWLRMSAAPHRSPDGSVVWSGNWSDITERRAMLRELEESKAAADRASRAKSTFLATMSHEIRTPMNGVMGMLELLSLTRLDGEQRTTLEVVRQSGRSLLRIIDDILDFSKIEAGKLELRPEAASIADVVERVCNVHSGNASSKGLLLERSIDRRIAPALVVDPVRLQQILGNLVANAIKFTPKGEVFVRAHHVGRADGVETVRFTVEDTGIGIAAEERSSLFKPFVQGGDTATRGFGGTGLGLAICQRLAGLMGGSIEMASEPGVGTSMTLTLALPVAQAEDLPRGADAGEHPGAVAKRREPPSVDDAAREGTLVLIVDDHPINRMVLERQVKALGYAAECAENGLEAVDMWSSGRYGAIITDCHMPEMNGYELAGHVRACESRNGHLRTPIIACTANALGGEAEKCLGAGMDDYLAKPIQLEELAGKLDQWLPQPGAAAAPPRRALPRFARSAAPIDASVLTEISAGDPVAEREILERFRRCNSEDAHLLLNAIEKADIVEVIHASHRIKGASKTVGAMRLAAVCERLERASRANDWPAVTSSMEAFSEELDRVNRYVGSI